MINQAGSKHLPLKELERHPKAFQKYIIASVIVSKIAAT